MHTNYMIPINQYNGLAGQLTVGAITTLSPDLEAAFGMHTAIVYACVRDSLLKSIDMV